LSAVALSATVAATTAVVPADAGPSAAQLSKRITKLQKRVDNIAAVLVLTRNHMGEVDVSVREQAFPASNGAATGAVSCLSGEVLTGGGARWLLSPHLEDHITWSGRTGGGEAWTAGGYASSTNSLVIQAFCARSS
jgi:hypothetical protein